MISVIVPIYNVEEYLDRCIKSIVEQTYRDLEIILVDDGSTDNCPSLCDNWEKKDARISVIHKANGGLSDARNVGIDKSRGEYIVFVDSDDYIMPKMCERLLTTLIENDADIALCNYFYDYGGKRKDHPMAILPGVYSGAEMVEVFFRQFYSEVVAAWCKIYRRNLFFGTENVRYPLGRFFEDEYTTYLLYDISHRVVIIPDALYGYMQRMESITHSYSVNIFLDTIEVLQQYAKWVQNRDENIARLVEMRCYDEYFKILYFGAKWRNHRKDFQPLLRKCRNFVISNGGQMLANQQATKKLKLKYILFRLGLLEKIYWFKINIIELREKFSNL